jgi:hypothetical protein
MRDTDYRRKLIIIRRRPAGSDGATRISAKTMENPKIIVLGVYKPRIPSAVYREQWQVTGSDAATDAHFEKLVLIEATVSNADERLRMKELGQMVDIPGFPRQFQCAYDEALLSADGGTLIDRHMKCVYGTGQLRFAFYLHFYDPQLPLETPYGRVECPTIQPVSDRLRVLVPYRACT